MNKLPIELHMNIVDCIFEPNTTGAECLSYLKTTLNVALTNKYWCAIAIPGLKRQIVQMIEAHVRLAPWHKSHLNGTEWEKGREKGTHLKNFAQKIAALPKSLQQQAVYAAIPSSYTFSEFLLLHTVKDPPSWTEIVLKSQDEHVEMFIRQVQEIPTQEDWLRRWRLVSGTDMDDLPRSQGLVLKLDCSQTDLRYISHGPLAWWAEVTAILLLHALVEMGGDVIKLRYLPQSREIEKSKALPGK